jgi:uracil-DNA glycosylase
MFVGQDWGDVTSLPALVENSDADMKSTTARELVKLLADVSIPLRDCFFTNALFGVRQTGSDIRRSLGWQSPRFIERCADALWLQIQLIRPRVLVCLGLNAPDLLVQLFPQCRHWQTNNFAHIDRNGNALLRLTPPVASVRRLAILLHPSFRKSNLHRRSYGGAKGHGAEVQLLRDSM